MLLLSPYKLSCLLSFAFLSHLRVYDLPYINGWIVMIYYKTCFSAQHATYFISLSLSLSLSSQFLLYSTLFVLYKNIAGWKIKEDGWNISYHFSSLHSPVDQFNVEENNLVSCWFHTFPKRLQGENSSSTSVYISIYVKNVKKLQYYSNLTRNKRTR